MEKVTKTIIKGAVPEIPCDFYSDGEWVRTSTQIPDEMELTLYINSQELVRVLCTPTKLNCLVLGFLYSQGIISNMSDVTSMRVCEDDLLADVKLSNPDYQLPPVRTLTSGCGGGATFVFQGQKIESDVIVSPVDILTLMKHFQGQMELYRFCGGVHASALADRKNILVSAEDIGRHNTLDKIQGESLLRKIPTKDKIILSTGRVSSEMLLKSAKMQVPIIVSRSSPTGRAVTLANDLGIALVGYARGNRVTVYSHPERLGHSS
jgi:FdhD protein